MKLLFDEHFSFRSVKTLHDIFPEGRHVKYFNLEQDSDETIWRFAEREGYSILTRDNDFYQKSLAWGHPPKVVWIRLANATRPQLERFLRERAPTIQTFLENTEESLLILS